MQFGGDDQWSNIISGVDLIRRELSEQAYGMTFALLTTSQGSKMGKTQAGALWLEPDKTSPYDFYQYWRNIEDADVKTCLSMLTFLPMDEVERLSALKDEEINHAKEVLAFEVTKLVHGEDEAAKAQDAARALFSSSGDMENVPTYELKAETLKEEGIGLAALMKEAGIASSNSDAFRAIGQGGVTLNGEKIIDSKKMLTEKDFPEGSAMIRKGKKVYIRILLVTLLMILSMALALGGCGLLSGGSNEPIEINIGGQDEPDTDESGKGDDFSDDAGTSDYIFLYPEYEQYIDWFVIPPDFVGGYGTLVEANPDAGYVNVRAIPSIDGDVVAELRHNDVIDWWIDNEVMEMDGSLWVGTYKVPNDNYTWTAVVGFDGQTNEQIRGWVALEVVTLSAI